MDTNKTITRGELLLALAMFRKLSPENQQALLALAMFRKLSPENQQALLSLSRAVVRSQGSADDSPGSSPQIAE